MKPVKTPLSSLRGVARTKVKGVTVEQMNDAIRRAASGWARSQRSRPPAGGGG